MRQKLLCAVLAAAMLLGLSGCLKAKEPIAEELIAGIEELEDGKYGDMSMKMSVEGIQDGKNVSLEMDTSVETQGDIAHIYDMSMSMGMTGMSIDLEMEGWADLDERVSYMNITALGEESGWMKSNMDGEDESATAAENLMYVLNNLSELEDGPEYTLEEHEKGEDYVVTWTVEGDDMEDILSDFMTDYDNINISEANAKAVFDSESRKLKSLFVEAGTDDGKDEATVKMTIELKEMNTDKKLTIPEEIIQEAVSMTGLPEVEEGPTEPSGPEIPDEPDTSGVSSDGNGTDEVIDALAEKLYYQDPDNYGVYTSHYDGQASLSYYASNDHAWSGSIWVDRTTDTELWGTPEEQFKEQVEFLREQTGSEPKSLDDSSAMFVETDEYGCKDVDHVSHSGDLLIKINLYTFDECDDEEASGYLQEMLAKLQ